MIIQHCPITGIKLQNASFPEQKLSVTLLHPILLSNTHDLSKLEPQTEPEHQLLVCALLYKLSELGLLEFYSAPRNLSLRWIKQELPHLQSFVNWAYGTSSNPRLSGLPLLRISHDVNEENIQSWRQACQKEASHWDTFHDANVARFIRAEREAAEFALTQSTHTSNDAKTVRAKGRVAFINSSLILKTSPVMVEYYCKLIASAHTYEVIQLQRAKEYFLEALPERRLEDYNDKQSILQLLDTVIVEKVGLATMLGITPSAESVSISDNIRNAHTSDGFITTPNRRLEAALEFAASSGVKEVQVTYYTSEPQKADFKSNLGYQIAHKHWSNQR